MHYSASWVKQDYGATGILYDLGKAMNKLETCLDSPIFLLYTY
jgi:hypothetical protein